jgi:alpha-tubulin suppressor-like RCC1 family protein
MKSRRGPFVSLVALSLMTLSFLVAATESKPAVAAPVNVVFKWKSISAGGYHTCGITAGDDAMCWGANQYGQLGNGSTSSSPLPQGVLGGLKFAQIAAGLDHTCGLALPNRDVHCWGRNSKRQLASGGSSNSSTPIRLPSGLQAVSISTAGDHTCVVTAAAEVWCWGSNESSGIGNGGGGDFGEVQNVPVREGARLQFSQVSVGLTHTCATAPAGVGYCWGSNSYAESSGAFTNKGFSLPTSLGGRQWYVLVAGESTSCGISRGLDDRQVFCWGRSDLGAAGLGQTTGSISSTAQALKTPIPSIPFTAISAGDAICGIATNGELYCWGGLPTREGWQNIQSTPVPLAAGIQFESIDVGYEHLCAISTSKDAYCWGANGSGQLGTGLTAPSTFPLDRSRNVTANTVVTTVATTAPSAITTTTSRIPQDSGPQRVSTGKPGTPCPQVGARATWRRKTTVCQNQGGTLLWK